MNSREAATFILFGIGLLVALARPGGRSALSEIAKAFAAWKVWLSFAFLGLNVATAVWLAQIAGLWTSDLVGSTILWFALVGFTWLLNLGNASEPGFISRKMREAVGFGAVLEVFVNLKTFSVPVEIVLQVVVASLVLMHVGAGTREKTQQVSSCMGVLLGLVVIGLVIYTVVSLISDWSSLDKGDLRNEFLFPIWLTLAVVPYIYLLGFFSTWGRMIGLMRRFNEGQRPRLRVLAGVFSELRGSIVDAGSFRHRYAREATLSGTFGGGREAARRFRGDQATDQLARAAARATLAANAGVKGLGSDGRTLDRREFAATKDALESLLYAHMGWYQQDGRPDEYRRDLLDMLISVDSEMSFDPPLLTKVRDDSQAWYAFRATPSGLVLGIGASGPPPSSWYYSDAKPPRDYPPGPGWVSSMEETPIEWLEEPET
jgi:hypothetical protein